MLVSRFRRLLLTDPLPPVSAFPLGVVSLSREMGARSVPFNVRTLSMLINAYANLGCLPYASSVFGRMLKTGCSPDVVTFNLLLRGLCVKGGEAMDEAIEFFQRLVLNVDCCMDVFTWTTLIKGLVQAGRVDQALMLFPEINNNYGAADCQPDAVTFNTVIHGLCKNGVSKEALELFQVMKSKKEKLSKRILHTYVRHSVLYKAVRLEVFLFVFLFGAALSSYGYEFLLLCW